MTYRIARLVAWLLPVSWWYNRERNPRRASVWIAVSCWVWWQGEKRIAREMGVELRRGEGE